MKQWYNPLPQTVAIDVLTKSLPTKGNMAWEYNPFRNYRLSKDMYEYDSDLYTQEELKDNYGLVYNEDVYYKGSTTRGAWCYVKTGLAMDKDDSPILRQKGELVDFVTDELKFDLSHPVTMIPQYSYDGSVNLILTDGTNQPRMINSRFSATGKMTYEIVDRAGSNDTNIYDQGEQFATDTSLYKRVKTIPKVELKSVQSGGNLYCGNYHFYFRLADADGNETDFVAESGLVSLFIGEKYPNSIYTGNKNENSVKQVTFYLSNLDPSYSYVYVYYSRYTAEDGENMVTSYKRIEKKYLINNFKQAKILITGEEETVDVSSSDINLSFNIIDSANCAATCKNMLFLGNVHKPSIDQQTFQDLSLRFIPYLKEEVYKLSIDQEYNISSTNHGYYDPLYIYNSTGYWDQELYRLGIVYILSNNSLSPVFNIRGRENIGIFKEDVTNSDGTVNTTYDSQYCQYYFTDDEDEDVKIQTNESTHILIQPTEDIDGHIGKNVGQYENSKGVVSFNTLNDTDYVHLIEVRVEEETIARLKNFGVVGFFFVRQTRIPLILSQAITIGLDKVGRLPTIPSDNGLITEIGNEDYSTTYIETLDLYGNNFISEGFLSRYRFELKKKKSSIWSKMGTIVAIGAIIAAGVCGAIFTGGASVGASALGVMLILGAMTLCGAAAGAVLSAVTVAIIASLDEMALAINRQVKTQRLKGRNSKISAGYYRSEVDDSRRLGYSFKSRLIIKDYTKNEVGALLCPDYDVNPQKYNQFYTGSEFALLTAKSQAWKRRFANGYQTQLENSESSEITAVTPEVSGIGSSTSISRDADGNVTTEGEDVVASKASNRNLNGLIIKQGYNFENDERHFFIAKDMYATTDKSLKQTCYYARLQAVPDDTACVTIGGTKFRSKAGNSSEAWRYECIGDDWKQDSSYNSDEDSDNEQSADTTSLSNDQITQQVSDKEINSDIVRGSYGPYIGMVDYNGLVGETVNIMIPGYAATQLGTYITIRMEDNSPFFAITDRIDLSDLNDYYLSKSNLKGDSTNNLNCAFTIARGDCYICQFTHRMNRNFNDENSPYNSEVVDSKSWKNNYKVNESEKFEKINLGDVNAINLGMWVTFSVRSSMNLNIRSLDTSVLGETAAMGHPRGFFPYYGMVAEGSHKSAEALVYNAGFTKSVGERYNFTYPDVPAVNNWYGTRIMFSDVQGNDSYTNGFRVFQGQNYVDYTREYGEIVKLLNYRDDLFVVFEHGLALLPVNERAIVTSVSSGELYLNSNKVIDKTLRTVSGSFGSIWPDSVISIPSDGIANDDMIFGVDTIAKKIWVYNGGTNVSIISDFKVQSFLNNNLTFGERENTPILGIRNVKTTYNAFKHDVMFTFYDDLTGVTEKVWNLCYNVLNATGQKFTTFYSWVPSFMENINNIPFSFDRNVSKWIAKLGQTHAQNSFAEGIVLSQNVYNNDGTIDGNPYFIYKYQTTSGEYKEYKFDDFGNVTNLIGILNLQNYILPEGDNVQYKIKFELLRDIYGYYKNFEIRMLGTRTLPSDAVSPITIPIYGLFLATQKEGYVYDYRSKQVLISEGSAIINEDPIDVSQYFTELYYRNKEGHSYNDYDINKVTIGDTVTVDGVECVLTEKNYFDTIQKLNLPIFHNRAGARVPLESPIGKKYIVQLLNVKATIYAQYISSDDQRGNEITLAEYMQALKANSAEYKAEDTTGSWINAGTYESSIAVTSKWNLQFLSSDFWKHGQAGVIDNTEEILPTKWYGEQHPFEFEIIVNDNLDTQKIFENLEIIANKAKPESFHFEIIGESYDFAPDKLNMYFRQEARKALFQYNGCDIEYNDNFTKLSPRQNNKSAELIHSYYERWDTINDIYDTYKLKDPEKIDNAAYYTNYNYWALQSSPNKDYRHLTGAEIVYYPTRQEFRIWQHQPAVDLADLSQDDMTSIVKMNCQYLEDKWRVTINPLLICYKNEYNRKSPGEYLFKPENSTWPNAQNADHSESNAQLPPITIANTCLPKAIEKAGKVNFPDESKLEGKDNALYGLYSWEGECPIDDSNWLDDVRVYKMDFGPGQNRKEAALRDKFIKIRVRYSGKELAIISLLKTFYTISYC